MKAVLTLNGSSANLGAATVARIEAASAPGVAFVNRDIPSGDGIVHAETKRVLGTITIGGLPANVTPPTGWNGYLVRVTGFTDDVVAEAGAGAAAPTISATGSISYWNGTGYSTLSITPADPIAIPVAAVHITQGQTQVDVVPNLATGGRVKTDPAGCAGACTRTSAQAQSLSPIVGDVTYSASYSGTTLCTLDLSVNFGAVTAKADYQAAPVA
jgi:hypothetical protein